tara:strand:- start:50 stop:421 length:372 start_codon:yes stop_codon:yes gene_type:complete
MSKTSIKRKNWVKKKSRTKKSLGVLGVYHRLIVFKSNKHIYCQLVDDNTNITVLSSSSIDNELNKKEVLSKNKLEISKEVGLSLGNKIKNENIKKVIFDRNGYRFHGRVKALVEAVKEKGIDI